MSVNSELAQAARHMNALAEQLPEEELPDLSALWSDLMDEIGDSRSEGSAILAIYSWRADLPQRLTRVAVA